MPQKKTLKPVTIGILYVIFLFIWSVYAMFGEFQFQNEFVNWLLKFIVHVICWPVFAVLLLNRYKESVPMSLNEMLRTAPNLKIVLPFAAFFIIYNCVGRKLNPAAYGNDMKTYDLIVTILRAGLFEEILFRGWFQNAISSFCSERKANLIAAALFTLVHYPKWIMHGYSVLDYGLQTVLIFVLGLIFGWVFRKNKSIWACAILHSLWDALVFLL